MNGCASPREMLPLVYDELRAFAQNYFRRQPAGFTLRPTELVHEAYLHIAGRTTIKWASPAHFRAIMTKKMWRLVIDHLRRRNAARRSPRAAHEHSGGNGNGNGSPGGRDCPEPNCRRLPLEWDAVAVVWLDQTIAMLDLDDALNALAAESQRLADVVKLRWFGGLPYTDVAAYMGVSQSSVEKYFRHALAWLNRWLAGGYRYVN